MSRRVRWGEPVLAVLVLAVFLAACAGSPPDVPVDEPATTEAVTTTTVARLPPDEDDSSGIPLAKTMVPPAPPMSKAVTCRNVKPPPVGSTTTLSRFLPTTTTTTPPGADPLANVHDRSRFQVITPCVTVSGKVQNVHTDPDGDVHFELLPDDPFVGLLNDKNKSDRRGGLVVKIVPADQPGCTKGRPIRDDRADYGTCTGADVLTPGYGAHVAVTGPYVLNRIRGWMEIHPAWAVNQQTAVPTTLPATVPLSPYPTVPGSTPTFGPSPTTTLYLPFPTISYP